MMRGVEENKLQHATHTARSLAPARAPARALRAPRAIAVPFTMMSVGRWLFGRWLLDLVYEAS